MIRSRLLQFGDDDNNDDDVFIHTSYHVMHYEFFTPG